MNQLPHDQDCEKLASQWIQQDSKHPEQKGAKKTKKESV
jgi:hypothetical protein